MVARAGAMTNANRIGVSRGTRISRGVRALRVSRRRASAPSAVIDETRGLAMAGSCGRKPGETVTAVMVSPSFLGGERIAGELQVNVVQRGFAGRDRRGADVHVVQSLQNLGGGPVVQ